MVNSFSITTALHQEPTISKIRVFIRLICCFRGDLSALVGRVNIKMKIRQERQGEREDCVDIIGKINLLFVGWGEMSRVAL